MMGRLSGGLAGEKSPGKSRIEKPRATPDGTRQATRDTRHTTGDTRHATHDWRNVTGGAKMASPTNKREGMQMRNPELACDWCGDEVANGEGVMVDDDRVCSECAEQGVSS